MKQSKMGFTLIELLGVITIFGILCALAIPPILNQVNKNKDVISEANLKIIYHATHLYFAGGTEASDTYCVTLQELVDRDLLESPLQDFETNREISLTRTVKMTTDASKKETYQLLSEGAICGTAAYVIGDEVQVKGIDGTFHVIEDSSSGIDTVKLLYKNSIGNTNYVESNNWYPYYDGSLVKKLIDSKKTSWQSLISNAGGTTAGFNMDTPTQLELSKVIKKYGYDPNGGIYSPANISWLNTTTFYTQTVTQSGAGTQAIFYIVLYDARGYFRELQLPDAGYGQAVRPVITIDKSNVIKVS